MAGSAYAQLQFSQSPYDSDGIQKSDRLIVSELKKLSELKQGYLNKEFDTSPESSIMGAEIQEQRSLLRIYEITRKKMEHQLNLRLSELTLLREKLEELNKQNRLLVKRLNQTQSGPLNNPKSLQPFDLFTTQHFVMVLGSAVKSIRNFVRSMIVEMKSADWDIEAAASSIEPDVLYSKADHKCFVFESYVSREMFDAFQFPDFSLHNMSLPDKRLLKEFLLDKFHELRSTDPNNFLQREPKSEFAKFCRAKYLRLVHPRMESAFFGDLSQRKTVNSGKFPDGEFFALFAEMAKWVWLLHCLSLSYEPCVSIFQVIRGSRFSEVYMENVVEERSFPAPDSLENDALSVAFTVVPGFKIWEIIVQCQVYLLHPNFNQGSK
ncbi:hypothetical protein CRG98_026844 [Punica granatum]|uniref:Uncharacterized protein n=1 Tax=Punica granatum TaxID=22663 RepID=A0A2I0J967_PUNGR|nr:hypothetical protein CRG98_026844 [Punica granatum]